MPPRRRKQKVADTTNSKTESPATPISRIKEEVSPPRAPPRKRARDESPLWTAADKGANVEARYEGEWRPGTIRCVRKTGMVEVMWAVRSKTKYSVLPPEDVRAVPPAAPMSLCLEPPSPSSVGAVSPPPKQPRTRGESPLPDTLLDTLLALFTELAPIFRVSGRALTLGEIRCALDGHSAAAAVSPDNFARLQALLPSVVKCGWKPLSLTDALCSQRGASLRDARMWGISHKHFFSVSFLKVRDALEELKERLLTSRLEDIVKITASPPPETHFLAGTAAQQRVDAAVTKVRTEREELEEYCFQIHSSTRLGEVVRQEKEATAELAELTEKKTQLESKAPTLPTVQKRIATSALKSMRSEIDTLRTKLDKLKRERCELEGKVSKLPSVELDSMMGEARLGNVSRMVSDAKRAEMLAAKSRKPSEGAFLKRLREGQQREGLENLYLMISQWGRRVAASQQQRIAARHTTPTYTVEGVSDVEGIKEALKDDLGSMATVSVSEGVGGKVTLTVSPARSSSALQKQAMAHLNQCLGGLQKRAARWKMALRVEGEMVLIADPKKTSTPAKVSDALLREVAGHVASDLQKVHPEVAVEGVRFDQSGWSALSLRLPSDAQLQAAAVRLLQAAFESPSSAVRRAFQGVKLSASPHSQCINSLRVGISSLVNTILSFQANSSSLALAERRNFIEEQVHLLAKVAPQFLKVHHPVDSDEVGGKGWVTIDLSVGRREIDVAILEWIGRGGHGCPSE